MLSTFFAAFFICASAHSKALNVEEAFQLALQRSETIGIAEQIRIQSAEIYAQAQSTLMPSIIGTATYTRQDTPPPGTASSISPADQRFARIQGVQPLFRGLAEYAALRQGKKSVEASEFRFQQARLTLYRDVATAFYDVLSQESDLVNFGREIQLNQDRLKELQQFRKIGRARTSEVLTSQSTLAALQGEVEATKGSLAVSREILRFLTGVPEEASWKDAMEVPRAALKVDEYLKDIEARPDLLAAKKDLEASGEGRVIARAGHFPSLNLIGNYYLTRPGFLENVKWDVQLALTVPIFQGGLVNAQMRTALALERQRDLEFERAKRLAEQDVRTQFASYVASLAQMDRLKEANDLGQRNYEQVRRDYRQGLVTNLEVIQILTSTQEVKRLFDRSAFAAKAGFLRLEASVGRRGLQ